MEKRRFGVNPAIIFDLIKAQAGTLSKAVLECVMNSVDAGASSISVELTQKGIRIADDGQGFQSRKEIEEYFEVFGFPHEEGDRIYGKFGIGRAQLWSFCSTVWRTATFEMTVDIKKQGLDYALKENLPAVKGVLIEGSFYIKLLSSERNNFEREFTELARYAQIPVLLNGKQVNKTPDKEKWDFDTKEAWIRLQDSGQLTVYNLGVLVRRYPAYQFGSGGVVVTKPGVRLALNMARNDILLAECKVWRRIRRYLQEQSDARVARKTQVRLSDGELTNIAQRFISKEVKYSLVQDLKLITNIVGRSYTFAQFSNCFRFWRNGCTTVTVAPLGSRLGEQAQLTKVAFVLSPVTLERFGVETVKELMRSLCRCLPKNESFLSEHLARIKTEEDLSKAAPFLKEGHQLLERKELKSQEAAALTALQPLNVLVHEALISTGLISTEAKIRGLMAGVSGTAEAWTDGSSQIVIERAQLRLLDAGIGGIVGLCNLLIHEYLHDADDAGSHTHDFEFYRRYHEATCGKAAIMSQAVVKSLCAYRTAMSRSEKRLKQQAAQHTDLIEQQGLDVALGLS